MSIIIGIDHGYYAIKTAHCSFPAGLTSYGEHEPYTRQGLLEFDGCFFVCGSGRQPIQRDKTINDNYYLLTLAAIAKEIRQRGLPPEWCCTIKVDIENSKSQYIEKDKQEATKDGSESTKIQHGI